MDNYYIDWVIAILNIYAYYLIGNKNKYGFILGLVGSIFSCVIFGFIFKSTPLLLMNLTFGCLNIINYIKWQV